MNKLRNAPASVIAAVLLTALGAGFNFAMGLLLALNPEAFIGIENPETVTGAPSRIVLISGVACIALGFVYVWVLKEMFNKSHFVFVMIYTISGINILFGLFRLPLGLLTISLNLIAILCIRAKSSQQWFAS